LVDSVELLGQLGDAGLVAAVAERFDRVQEMGALLGEALALSCELLLGLAFLA
jgi:hypothetical protein